MFFFPFTNLDCARHSYGTQAPRSSATSISESVVRLIQGLYTISPDHTVVTTLARVDSTPKDGYRVVTTGYPRT
jgi:hypothetical protein